MTNLEYVNSIIRSNDMIYIDTSSLMNVMELRKFLESYYQIFVDYNKRIIVTREVCLEIYRHLISKVETKQYKSQKVIEVLKQYKEIFTNLFYIQSFKNSITLSLVVSIISIIICSITAYFITKLSQKTQDMVLNLIYCAS